MGTYVDRNSGKEHLILYDLADLVELDPSSEKAFAQDHITLLVEGMQYAQETTSVFNGTALVSFKNSHVLSEY